MKTLFDIGQDNEAQEEDSLLLEVGKNYCVYGFWNGSEQAIRRMKFLSYDEINAGAEFDELFGELRSFRFKTAYICSAFEQAILSPTPFFKGDYALLESLFVQPAHKNFSDAIPEWQMVNLYSVPQLLVSSIAEAFPSLHYLHVYTPTIKIYNGFVSENQLMVHFTPQHFRVLLKKGPSIHLVQTYHFTAPLDVIYYLLKITYEVNLEPSSMDLILSGLIEKDSALFEEIEQYFSQVHFSHLPQIKLPDSNHPHYYFNSLYNLAACVS